MTNNDKLLTRKEAAEYLGLKADTLAVWAVYNRYNLPMIKVGGLVRYRLSHLDEFLESRTIRNEVEEKYIELENSEQDYENNSTKCTLLRE